MRAFTEHRPALFELLYDSIKQLGLELYSQIDALLVELRNEKKESIAEKKSADEPRTSHDVGESISAGTAPHEVILPPALKAFTTRNNQPKRLLRSLETVSYIRNQLRNLEKKRKPVPAEPEKPKETV